MLLTGCADGRDASGLPTAQPVPPSSSPTTVTATATPSPTVPAADVERQEVLRAVQRYDRLTYEFESTGTYDFEKLKTIMVEPMLTSVAKGILGLQSMNYVLLGSTKVSVRKVTVNGTKATVLRCLDPTGTFLAKGGTTTRAPDTAVAARTTQTLTVTKVAARWLVSGTGRVGKC